MKRTLGIGTIALVGLALAGCSFSANFTIPAESFAKTTASALEGLWGAAPDSVDCGEDSVDVVVGTAVDCTAVNSKSGLTYDVVSTISEVNGDKYTVTAVPGDGYDPNASTDDPSVGAPTVAPTDLADLAASALAKEIGYTPAIDCGTDPVAIYVDALIECVATGNDGLNYAASITVTEVTETDYKINVQMGAKPID